MATAKKTALLIVDMINKLDFSEGPKLLKRALPAAKRIAQLKARFERKGFPVIYVNDNFEDWQSDWKKLYQVCSAETSRGRELSLLLEPNEQNYFILKPRHSGFIATPLELLLRQLHVKRVVVTGVAGDICVLFTAHDAHSLGFEVVVPEDCIASNTNKQDATALLQLQKALKIPTTRSNSLRI